MAQPLNIALPPNLVLWDGCIIRVTAIDATTGALVTGVDVADVSFEVSTDSTADLTSGNFKPVLLRTSVASTP